MITQAFRLPTRSPARRRAQGIIAMCVLAGIPAATVSSARGVTRSWIGSSGLWQTSANWSGGQRPATGDDVVIVNQDAVDRTVTYLDVVSLHSLQLGNAGSGTNTLGVGAGQLDANLEQIGVGVGKGILTQSGGLNSLTLNAATAGLLLGSSTFSAGTYNLNGGTLNVAGTGTNLGMVVGSLFNGTFNQSAGTHLISGSTQLIVGDASFATGVYLLSGGTLNVTANVGTIVSQSEVIGNSGAGNFLQTGGINSINPAGLVIGNKAGSSGIYSMTGGGGTLSAAYLELIGNLGAGTFNQSAGTNTASFGMVLGNGTGSSGRYLLSGTGVLNALQELIGSLGPGTFNQNGGTNTTIGLMIGGNTAPGIYSQTGGTLNCGTELIAVSAGSVGTLDISGGTNAVAGTLSVSSNTFAAGTCLLSGTGVLSVSGTEKIGGQGAGTLIQSGGSDLITGDLVVGEFLGTTGSAGTCLLTAGTFNTVGNEFIGFDGNGVFTQTGGTHTLGSATINTNLEIGHDSNGNGTYQLGGDGVLVVHGTLDLGNGGDGTFVQSGGTASVSGGDGFQIVVGQATLSGGVLTTNALVISGSASSSAGSPSSRLSINTAGDLIVTGTLKAWRGSLNLGPGGSLTVGSIDLTGNPAILHWTGGSLKFTSATAELGAFGPFGSNLTLSAGQTFIPAAGLSIQSGATLTLQGGALQANDATNRGTFIQTSGSLSVSSSFINSGTANFGGQQLWSPSSVFANTAGVATFNSPLNPAGFGPAVVITGGSVTFNSSQQLQQFSLSNAIASSATGGGNTLKVQSLLISPTGRLDLANNSMIIDYTGSPGALVDDVRQHLLAGRIFSSVIDSHTALGYGDNAVLHKTTLGGIAVDPTSLLIKYTYLGDANLDGQVDVTDLGALATNWQTTAPWTGGDFNYDGFVDVTDLGVLATNWQQGVGSPLATSRLDEALASVGLSRTEVPEPAVVSFLCASPAFLRRRRT